MHNVQRASTAASPPCLLGRETLPETETLIKFARDRALDQYFAYTKIGTPCIRAPALCALKGDCIENMNFGKVWLTTFIQMPSQTHDYMKHSRDKAKEAAFLGRLK